MQKMSAASTEITTKLSKRMPIVCYIPMLEGQTPEVERWMEEAGTRYGMQLVLLPRADWNNDLTPWPAAPVFKKGKSFGGNAEAYLQRLENETIPELEKKLGYVPNERWLLGVSLAGLFAIWATARSSLFTRVAAISGSFWYPDFPQWLQTQRFSPTLKAAYFSLGRKEAEGKNPQLKDITAQTQEVVDILTEKGVKTYFAWTEGTHFAPVVPRMEQALRQLQDQ